MTELREGAEKVAETATPVLVQHDSLAAALVAALADLSVVEKGRTAKIEMKGGGHYTYGYADLADVVKVTRPVLARHGVVALTPLHSHGSDLACSVTLLHESGDRIDFGPFPFPHGRDAQATGSMVTYMRRYALVAALGMAAGDDDDGASAKPREQAVEWTRGMSKQHLKNRVGDDAAAAWEWGSGDELPLSQEAVDELADRWLSRPMTEEMAGDGSTPAVSEEPAQEGLGL